MIRIHKHFWIILSLVALIISGANLVFSEEPPQSTKNQQEIKKEDSEKPQISEKSRESSEKSLTLADEQEKDKTKKQEARKKAFEMLLQKDFRYSYIAAIGNPFVPFVQPPQQKTPAEQLVEGAPPPPVLLTPLQKMELGEIERGFKGVLWASNERKAIIEDSTGKGYIVGIGTPIGNQDGFVSAIFQDRIIIRQKVWDKTSRSFKDEDVIVKLRKKPEEGEPRKD